MDSRLLSVFLKFSRLVPSRVLSKFDGLKRSLARASVRIGFVAYMGMSVLVSLIAGVGAFFGFFSLLLGFGFAVGLAVLFAVLIGVLSSFLGFGICYLYPLFVASSHGGKIDANLPIIANFMSVLASSGMPPENIFRSLGRVGEEFSVNEEVKSIIGDVELMGADLHTALKNASERSPSKKFAALLDSVATTAHMGGDLALYLREEADKYKRARMLKMRRFLDNLGVIAETYITFMVAAPLVLIVMLSVMSFVGAGVTLGGLEPRVLLDLLTFVIMPAGIAVLVLVVDSMTPQR